MKNSMKTFAEQKGEEPINWFEMLQRSQNEIDWDFLAEQSVSWVTCACGNQCVKIPRERGGAPRDPRLKFLGFEFTDAISQGDKSWALRVLEDIEKRSGQILAEMEVGK